MQTNRHNNVKFAYANRHNNVKFAYANRHKNVVFDNSIINDV